MSEKDIAHGSSSKSSYTSKFSKRIITNGSFQGTANPIGGKFRHRHPFWEKILEDMEALDARSDCLRKRFGAQSPESSYFGRNFKQKISLPAAKKNLRKLCKLQIIKFVKQTFHDVKRGGKVVCHEIILSCMASEANQWAEEAGFRGTGNSIPLPTSSVFCRSAVGCDQCPKLRKISPCLHPAGVLPAGSAIAPQLRRNALQEEADSSHRVGAAVRGRWKKKE